MVVVVFHVFLAHKNPINAVDQTVPHDAVVVDEYLCPASRYLVQP